MTVTRPQGLIFDLGETLMYIPDDYQFEPRIAKLIGRKVMDVTALVCDVYCSEVGLSSANFVASLSERLNNEGYTIAAETVREICMDSVEGAQLQTDVIESLTVLRRRGFALTLVSNTSPLSWARIARLGLSTFFDHIIFSCDIGYLKPDPRIFMHALTVMKTLATETCVVGDKIRTLILGGAILGARLILVERRMTETVFTDQIPTYAIVPSLRALTELRLLGGVL